MSADAKNAPSRPAPRATPETAEYWKALHEGRLMLSECESCGKLSHPPQAACAFCWRGKLKPRQAAGGATLNSFSIIRQTADPAFKARVPYVLAYVDLEEGVSLVSNVINCDIDKVAVGMKLRAVFEQTSADTGVVLFEPA
jgi:uncharacterized OB-fold protein